MTTPRLAAIGATASLLLVSSAIAGTAEVGGPPTQDFERCSRTLRPCTDPVVIGVGRNFNGPVEIVAYKSRRGLCVHIDRRGTTVGSCGGNTRPVGRRAIDITHSGFSLDRPDASYLSGPLRPNVAKVVVRYRRNGDRKKDKATVAQVDGELLDAVGVKKPFGFFDIAVRGCVNAREFRAIARNDAGEVIGRDRTAGGGCPPS